MDLSGIELQINSFLSVSTKISLPALNKRTGLVIDSYFSGTKIKWLLDNCNEGNQKAQNGDLAFGTIDCWLLWKLTDGKIHATDYTNASRTLFFNINSLQWSRELLKIFNLNLNKLTIVK